MISQKEIFNVIKINSKVKIYTPNDCCHNAIGKINKIYIIDNKIWYDVYFDYPIYTKLRIIKRGIFNKKQLILI